MTRALRPLPLLFLFACTAALDVPLGAQITCTSDVDCFNGQRCLLDIRLCVDPGQSCVVEVPGGFDSVGNGTTCTQRDGASGVCLGGRCLQSSCGDAFVDPSSTEECDDGVSNSDSEPNACRTTCKRPGCGDGIFDDKSETCDDGNTTSGDGCRADCKKLEVCNDAEVDANEACDDGNDNPNDGCDQCRAVEWPVTVVMGIGINDGDLDSAYIGGVGGITSDLSGFIYVGDTATCRVLRIDEQRGTVTAIAGSGVCASSSMVAGDPARGTDINAPGAMAIDSDGNLFVAFNDARIWRIDHETNRLRVVVGTGQLCASGQPDLCANSAQATNTRINNVTALAFDATDRLFYAEGTPMHDVRQVDVQRDLQFLMVGTTFTAGSSFSDNGPGGDALLSNPTGLAVDAQGVLYIMDFGNKRITRYDVDPDRYTVFAGNGGSTSSPDGSIAKTSSINVSNPSFKIARVLETGELLFIEPNKIRTIGIDGRLGTIAAPATIFPFGITSLIRGGIAFTKTSLAAPDNLAKVQYVAGGVLTDLLAGDPLQGVKLGQASTATQLRNIKAMDAGANGDVVLTYNGPSAVFRANAATGVFEIIAGNGSLTGEGVAANEAKLQLPTGLRLLANGDVVFADSFAHSVRKIDAATHTVTTVAGTNGTQGSTGDGGLATAARLNQPGDVEVADNGDLYIYNCGNFKIRKVTAATGFISTVVGTGTACASGACGDGASALSAQLGASDPQSTRPMVRVTTAGDIVMSDPALKRVRKVSGGIITTIAGDGTQCASAIQPCGDGGAASAAQFVGPGGIALDGTGLLIADSRVRRIDTLVGSAIISTVAFGNGNAFVGDGRTPLQAGGSAQAITRLADGSYYVSSTTLVRKVANGLISTVAGAVDGIGDGPLFHSVLAHPNAMTAFGRGKWLIADGAPGRVRLYDEQRPYLSSVVGYPNGIGFGSDALHSARFCQLLSEPDGIAYDVATSSLFVSEGKRGAIERVHVAGDPSTWTIEPYAGDFNPGYADGNGLAARFAGPHGLALDVTRNTLWVADTNNHAIRRIDLGTDNVTTYVGLPPYHGFAGDGGPVSDAFLDGPTAIAVNPVDGSLYIADTGNNRVRRVAPSGADLDGASIIDTVLGDGSASASGSGSPARLFPVDSPRGLAFDGYGDLWVTSRLSVRIVTPGADGIPTGEDAVLTVYGAPPRSSFPENDTQCLTAVQPLPGDGAVYVTDACGGYLLRLDHQAIE